MALGSILKLLFSRRLLVDGLLLSLALSVFVLGTVFINVWLWFGDYPPEIQELVENPPAVPFVQRLVLALLGLGMIVWLMVRSTRAFLRGAPPENRFILAMGHAFLLFQFANLWDVVIIDWLVFVTWTPEVFVLPGTEGSPGYDNYWFHFRASFLRPSAWIGGLVASAIIAGIARWGARRSADRGLTC